MRTRFTFCGLLLVSSVLPFQMAGLPALPPDGKDQRKATNEAGKTQQTDRKAASDVVVRASAPEMPLVPYRFPEDRGGRLLSRLLAPPERLPPLEGSGPVSRPVPKAIESPTLPLPAPAAPIRSLPASPGRGVLFPRLRTPEPALGGTTVTGSLPAVTTFSTGDLIRAPSIDVNQPVDLPLLSRPLPDRAPLTDPTLTVSRATALSAAPPARTEPAPYVRFTLPDPFENRDTVRLRMPNVEAVPGNLSSRPVR
jgi:hypothetical protein